MYGLDGSFGQFAAFVGGYGMADPRALDGWREWLVLQFDDGNNLAWPGLVLRLAFPDRTFMRPLDEADDHRAGETLFRLLDRFLDERDSGGAAAIQAAHQAWIRRQSWYRPSASTQEAPGDGGH
jgi:hypothetical protein